MARPVDPCPECRRREGCRLPLNCPKYLRFQQAVQQAKADKRERRRCTALRLYKFPHEDDSVTAYYREAARACPWEPVERNVMEKISINHDEAMRLYEEGATGQQMAKALGVSTAAVSRWKKKNDLTKGRDTDSPAEQAENRNVDSPAEQTEQPAPTSGSQAPPSPVTAWELAVRDGSQRVEALMRIMREDDNQLVRDLFGELAYAITRQAIHIAVNAAAKEPDGEEATAQSQSCQEL